MRATRTKRHYPAHGGTTAAMAMQAPVISKDARRAGLSNPAEDDGHGHDGPSCNRQVKSSIAPPGGPQQGRLVSHHVTWTDRTAEPRRVVALVRDRRGAIPGLTERGPSSENTNGLLRRYFPKVSDLRARGPDDLAAAAAELNARLRKTLGWDTPAGRLGP